MLGEPQGGSITRIGLDYADKIYPQITQISQILFNSESLIGAAATRPSGRRQSALRDYRLCVDQETHECCLDASEKRNLRESA